MKKVKVSVNNLPSCPECGSNWVSSVIPAERREHYTWPYFYSRIQGQYDIVSDRVEQYMCPDCNTIFPRFGQNVKTYEVDKSCFPT